MPALAMTDHGNVFGAYDFYKQANAAGVKPIIGMEGRRHAGSGFDRAPFDFGDNLSTRTAKAAPRRGKAAYTDMTCSPHDGGHHRPVRTPSMAAASRASTQAALRPRPVRLYGKGLDRHHRRPVGGGDMWRRAVRRTGPPGRRPTSGHLRRGEVLRRADGPRPVHREEAAAAAGHRQGPRHPALATTTCTTPTRTTRTRDDALLCIQTGSRLERPTAQVDGNGYYLKSAAEMRALFTGELPSRLRQHPAGRRAVRGAFTRAPTSCRGSRCCRGEDEISWFVKEVERGLHKRSPCGIRRPVREQADYEVGIMTRDGLPGVPPRGR